MNRHSFEIPYQDPVNLFDAYHARPYALFLDSADRKHPDARFSFIMSDPAEILSLTIKDNKTPCDQLKSLQEKYTFKSDQQTQYPFTGGIAGYFGYDLGRTLEQLPLATHKITNEPDMLIGVYAEIIAFDHHNQTAHVFIWSNEQPDNKHPLKPQTHNNDNPAITFECPNDSNTQSAVEKTINYICAGDIFQANIAQNYTAKLPNDFCPWSHYKHLRKLNPAPFAAYMNGGDTIIASTSPERFLTLKDSKKVITRPIKGTLPADQNPSILENNQKDRAENIMIVDLLRNDISKTCTAESIEVTELCKLETFSSVHHLVSTVEGQLQTDKTASDLLTSCFPGGSITGAPKIRAMEIIDALEPFKRGAYCGALGYIGFDGAMDTNILIRTLVYNMHAKTLTLKTGSGITAQSNPAAEVQEMHDKAARILESFQ